MRLHYAMELADQPNRLQGGTRFGSWLHDGSKAVGSCTV